MVSNGVLDLHRGDTETGLPPHDSPLRDTERPAPNDSDDSEVVINRNEVAGGEVKVGRW